MENARLFINELNEKHNSQSGSESESQEEIDLKALAKEVRAKRGRKSRSIINEEDNK